MSTGWGLYWMWSKPITETVDEKTKRANEDYRAALDSSYDVGNFQSKPTLLYALVDHDEWERSNRFYPEDPLPPVCIQLYTSIPRTEIARRCFATEVESAVVTRDGTTRSVNHTKIGANNTVLLLNDNADKADETSETRIVNNKFLVLVVALHDYELVFANFGASQYVVSETKFSEFTIPRADINCMKLFLKRPIDRQLDVCITFAPMFHSSQKFRGISPQPGLMVPSVSSEMLYRKLELQEKQQPSSRVKVRSYDLAQKEQ
jgi:hypothetical protein